MVVRVASRNDIPQIADVVATAYGGMALWDLLTPHIKKYPEDWKRHWERQFRERMRDPKKVLLVSEDEDEVGIQKIVWVCCWQRLGESSTLSIEEGKGGGLSWAQQLVDAVTLRISSYFYPDRTADPTKTPFVSQFIQNLFARYCTNDTGDSQLDLWFLWTMAVHPDQQRKGHGHHLLNWGLRKAREDGVDIRLLSSPNAQAFYEAYGFTAIGLGNLDPLADVESGPVMDWSPSRQSEGGA